MRCERCQSDFDQAPCVCGWSPPRALAAPDETIETKSGRVLPRCQWRYAQSRCGFPANGRVMGQPRYCSWHHTWARIAESHPDTAEYPAFVEWWRDYVDYHGNSEKTQSFWGHNLDTVWDRLHGKLVESTVTPEPIPPVSGDLASAEYWVKAAVMDWAHGHGTIMQCLERHHPGPSITADEQARYTWLIKKLAQS